MSVGGWWVIVPIARRGGPTVGEPLSEPLRHHEGEARLREMQKDTDQVLGLAYVRDDDGEQRDESGAIVQDVTNP